MTSRVVPAIGETIAVGFRAEMIIDIGTHSYIES